MQDVIIIGCGVTGAAHRMAWRGCSFSMPGRCEIWNPI